MWKDRQTNIWVDIQKNRQTKKRQTNRWEWSFINSQQGIYTQTCPLNPSSTMKITHLSQSSPTPLRTNQIPQLITIHQPLWWINNRLLKFILFCIIGVCANWRSEVNLLTVYAMKLLFLLQSELHSAQLYFFKAINSCILFHARRM
jgi:hypothetical protein